MKIWNLSGAVNAHVLLAARKRLPVVRPAKESFAGETAGGRAGGMNKSG